MKRILVICLVVAASMLLVSGMATAGVTGQCSGCHTMHNSQNGATVNGQVDGRDNLLKGNCLTCHYDTGANRTANSLGPNVGYTGVDLLPSGTFGQIAANNTVHNVTDLSATIGAETLGNLNTLTPGGATPRAEGGSQLTCAGTNGCHGTTAAGAGAIKGSHHDPNPAYRFLYYNGVNGVTGKRSADWQEDNTNHNVYSSNATSGISVFCAQCHGGFHGTADTNSSTPFKRHPTDLNIGANGTAGFSSTIDVTTVTVPFGYADVSAISTSATTTSANPQVICVSCHRAHGSAQPDLLRFDYAGAGANAGGGATSGCLTCHVRQR